MNMFGNILQQLTGEGGGQASPDQVHSHLDTLLGSATSEHTGGAVSDALGALGARGFAQSVMQAAEGQNASQRGTVGSMLFKSIESGGGNPSSVLSSLGIGQKSPQDLSHSDLGSLAGYVAQNHPDALSGVLGNASGGGGNLEGTALHLLGNQMVQQTALNLAKRFL